MGRGADKKRRRHHHPTRPTNDRTVATWVPGRKVLNGKGYNSRNPAFRVAVRRGAENHTCMLMGTLYIHADDLGVRHVVRIATTPNANDVLVGVQFLGSRETIRVRRSELTIAIVPEYQRLR